MATNMVRCSYQEIIDMHTESGHVTAIGIHTPTGSTPREMFCGFFDQFKKMKYLGCSLSFVPVATLPADPSQVNYEAGEPGIDPRDLVNPIMFHGCHGDDLGGILNKLYGDNDEISSALDGIDYDGFGTTTQSALALTLHRLYYKALTDKSWKKAHPQKGFKKSGLRPLVYSLAANRQLGYGMDPFNAGDMNIGSNGVVQVIGGDPTSNYPVQQQTNPTSAQGIQFMTPRLTSLGWIETKNVLTSTVLLRQPATGTALEKMQAAIADAATRQTNYTELPKIFMGVILLAPAYKTELYFRVIINHYFAFKGFRGVSFKPEVTGVPAYYDRNDDVFDINPTFPDLPNDFSGFGSGDGGDNGSITEVDTTLNIVNESTSTGLSVLKVYIDNVWTGSYLSVDPSTTAKVPLGDLAVGTVVKFMMNTASVFEYTVLDTAPNLVITATRASNGTWAQTTYVYSDPDADEGDGE